MHRFGRPVGERPSVFPRTRMVRDALDLVTTGEDARAVLRIRAADGSVVLRRDLSSHPTHVVNQGTWKVDPEHWDARDTRGRPLPPGRYEATVRGVDRVGNRGTSNPLVIRVSRRLLEWVERPARSYPLMRPSLPAAGARHWVRATTRSLRAERSPRAVGSLAG